jgi:DEAD/DEAH box helicase domain-containing protein
MHTTSFWWRVPAAACLEAGVGRAGALDGLRGILRALETAATISLMCEPRDIGQSIEDGCLAGESTGTGSEFDPTLFLFDNVPGGIGLAARIHEQAAALLVRVRTLLSSCACERGCPQCVGATDPGVASPPPTGGGPVSSRKRASMLVLDRLLRADA